MARQNKLIDWKLIMSFGPCKDNWPEEKVRRYLPEPVTLVELLRMENVSTEDRLWVALREELLDKKTLRLFACDCAERALNQEREQGREPDQRSWNVIAVARRYAHGEASEEELRVARVSAWLAWVASAEAAAEAAEAAAARAARAAAASAWTAAWAAAWAAARVETATDEREWQVSHLIEMIEASNE